MHLVADTCCKGYLSVSLFYQIMSASDSELTPYLENDRSLGPLGHVNSGQCHLIYNLSLTLPMPYSRRLE
eukprot:scaffold346464_cov39-Prasinocladus_malaysianus.AAC.1